MYCICYHSLQRHCIMPWEKYNSRDIKMIQRLYVYVIHCWFSIILSLFVSHKNGMISVSLSTENKLIISRAKRSNSLRPSQINGSGCNKTSSFPQCMVPERHFHSWKALTLRFSTYLDPLLPGGSQDDIGGLWDDLRNVQNYISYIKVFHCAYNLFNECFFFSLWNNE